jgi:hypothetical protein
VPARAAAHKPARGRYNQWQCASCDKYFKSEAYLDQHFENRHAAQLGAPPFRCSGPAPSAHACPAGKSGRRHCLADYCGILGGCRPAADAADDPVCDVKVSARLQHSCSLLASTCFAPQHHSDPAVAELSAAVAAKFRSKFCLALLCHGARSSEDSDDVGFWERSKCRCPAAAHNVAAFLSPCSS